MSASHAQRLFFCSLATVLLAACGGAGGEIGGTLSGLGPSLSVVLQNNNGDNLTLSTNGSFTFPTTVSSGAAYSVTVLTQPTGQTCTVANGSGTVSSNSTTASNVTNATNVTNVSVTCTSTSSISGTLSGLTPGTSVTLIENTQQLTLATNGPFAFPGVLAAGTAYTVTISVQPAGHTCTVANGTGTVVANAPATVTVTCQ